MYNYFMLQFAKRCNVSSDNNITVAVKVASKLENSFDTFAQHLLVSIYKKLPLLGYNIFGITYGQILMAIVLFVLILFIRPILVSILIKFTLKLTKKTETKYDDRIVKSLREPLKFLFLILGLYIFVSILYIQNHIINLILASLAMYNLFWIIYSIIKVTQGIVFKAMNRVSGELSDSISKFILRIIYILIWVVGASSILSLWGVNVTALIASLGLGGLAFALAAKDTAANLFGSIAILLDKSIKIGDWIKVDGVEGIVEDIGMRTTKIRTFYKSLVVVPNQIVANSHIENFSRRNSRRILMRLGLTYDTTNEQIESIIKDIKALLKSHKGIAQDETMLVNFDNFGDSAKEIFVYTFTNTANWQEYLNIKEDIAYQIDTIVSKHGSSFAFPSQSIYIEQMPKKVG